MVGSVNYCIFALDIENADDTIGFDGYGGAFLEPFKADKREVIGLGIELDDEGKGLLDWKKAE